MSSERSPSTSYVSGLTREIGCSQPVRDVEQPVDRAGLDEQVDAVHGAVLLVGVDEAGGLEGGYRGLTKGHGAFRSSAGAPASVLIESDRARRAGRAAVSASTSFSLSRCS
jgi:hypothetical protein